MRLTVDRERRMGIPEVVWPVLVIAVFIGFAFWILARGKKPPQ